MSLAGQAKLLRVLEDKTVVRVGGSRPIHTEVRILAATNQDLAAMVRQKKFREDLYFRLNVVSLELPPLREGGDDTLRLAEFFLLDLCPYGPPHAGILGRRPPASSPSTRGPAMFANFATCANGSRTWTSGDTIEADDLAFLDAGGGDVRPAVDLEATLAEATRQFQEHFIRQRVRRPTRKHDDGCEAARPSSFELVPKDAATRHAHGRRRGVRRRADDERNSIAGASVFLPSAGDGLRLQRRAAFRTQLIAPSRVDSIFAILSLFPKWRSSAEAICSAFGFTLSLACGAGNYLRRSGLNSEGAVLQAAVIQAHERL